MKWVSDKTQNAESATKRAFVLFTNHVEITEGKVMLLGFVLLVSACGHDDCEALAVSERIYHTQSECETKLTHVYKQHPHVVLMCKKTSH